MIRLNSFAKLNSPKAELKLDYITLDLFFQLLTYMSFASRHYQAAQSDNQIAQEFSKVRKEATQNNTYFQIKRYL